MCDLIKQPLVDRLPTEILAHVLVLYANDAFERRTKERHFTQWQSDIVYALRKGKSPYVFLDVTRRWRAVTLSCPGFWSNIVVGPRRKVKLLLERSGNCALYVFCLASDTEGHDTSDTRHAVLKLTLEHLHRIRSLQLIVRARDAGLEPCALYDTATAPLLGSLSIFFVEDTSQMHENIRKNPIRSIGAKWIAPRLLRLRTHGGSDRSTTLNNFVPLQLKDTLTHLVWLPAHSFPPRTPFSCAEDVLLVLKSLQHLETLHIGFAKELADDLSASQVTCAKLPYPRRLLLEGNVDICLGVLERLEFPELLQQFGVLVRRTSRRNDGMVQLTDFLIDFAQSQDWLSPNVPVRQF
ncbi:uncharacterized protein PHACADRAFT_250808 [Phanerochaete carnosa HHB-10118-sp]|uniref:F-box domain-containing protein n=1 Tax=Phanerochaete carnosa (strain HHB-10118-sp) TaxID=650164 RepID=K5WKP2_PHACS|nr:uncharacterized protein PHACADRAFT_250808 [Phanerochaete carnosa HHB-10118-sp]EKM59980.1 hypothetical protein PHACADRAFT_250808 [Phanerochaete carnosa HHB-10118-sp]